MLQGVSDSNHTPLTDFVDSSPFISDMLDDLAPVALSNGCTSPSELLNSTECFASASPQPALSCSPTPMDTSNIQGVEDESSAVVNNCIDNSIDEVMNVENYEASTVNDVVNTNDNDTNENIVHTDVNDTNSDSNDKAFDSIVNTEVNSANPENNIVSFEDNVMNVDENNMNDNEIVTSAEVNAVPTSKAVEELVKMVTKLSEDLQAEKKSLEQYSNQSNIENRDDEDIIELYTAATNIDNDCSIIE